MSALPGLCSAFRRLMAAEDGVGVVRLLDPDRRGSRVPLHELQRDGMQDCVLEHGGEPYGELLDLYLRSLRARVAGQALQELEVLCTCLKTWVQRYMEAEGTALWMTPMIIFLCATARRVAGQLDQSKRSDASQSNTYLKKLVEIHRELFQKLNKERQKRAGYVWVTCELLRAYFRLGQVSQCSFLLTAVRQSLDKDGFNPIDLPKAITVTFYYYWGKHCVFDTNLRDADEKLSWAFKNSPVKALSHRRKILLYLVPVKLRLGILPTQALLAKHDLDMFVEIVKAIRDGNAQVFTAQMEEYAADFIKMGTYLLMMKLKFMVFRNLCKGVHCEVRRTLGEGAGHKLDLACFERAFEWQDGCDADEAACVLSNLIFQGAVKGYLSHEHRKLVFAKDMPFPPPSKWQLL